MTAERDRLAALLHSEDATHGYGACPWAENYMQQADRLIAAGAFDLDVERLARALHNVACGTPHALGLHDDFAAAIAAAYREDAGIVRPPR